MIKYTISIQQWNFWYGIAILNSLGFFLISLLTWGLYQDGLGLSLIGLVFYFLLSSFAFLKLVMSGGSLAPIAWFILGSGIFFGAGTSIWMIQLCNGLICSSGGMEIAEKISNVNLLNASSTLVVLIAASKQSFQSTKVRLANSKPVVWNWVWMHKVTIPFVGLAIVLNFYYFPVPENFMVRTLLSKLNYVIPLFMFLTGVEWRKLSGARRVITIILISGVLVTGLLSFSKTDLILPILVLLSGIWVAQRSFLSIIIPGLILVAFYALLLAPTISSGRSDLRYDDARNSILDRIEILSAPRQKLYGFEESRFDKVSRRFAHGFIQTYLIEQYNSEKPGESLKDFWVALVPRALWPNKPNITRFGTKLHEEYRQVRNSRSALAPTYSAEAYWNYGVAGVLLVSLLIGLELGWLSKKWFESVQGKDTAFLIIAFPAAFLGFNVEAWIVASYIGGFITLIAIWWGLKFVLDRVQASN